MVMPEPIKEVYISMKDNYAQGCSKIGPADAQQIHEGGHYQKHIRRIRRIYAEKSILMSSIIKRKYTDVMDVVSSSSGLYIIVEIKTGRSEAEVVEKINAAGIKALTSASAIM